MKLKAATLALSLLFSLSSLVTAGSSSRGGLALVGGSHRQKARALGASSAASLTRRQTNANVNGGGGGDNGGGDDGQGDGGGNADEDPQTSLTLDPSQVQPGLALDGQQVPAANQVASATSVNNFINFCLTRADLPLTNGAQVKTGSCNNVPMGVIAAQDKAPTSKFLSPPNLATIQSNTDFTVQMAINNLVTGNFVNAQSNYFSAPQNTDDNGIIIGHSHVVIEQIDKLDSTTVTNSQNFAFFKGFNEAADNGILSADVTGGLPAGVYKMSSINSASNHQPALIGVAQHGSLDDAVYFTVSDDAAAEGDDQGGDQGGAQGDGTNDDQGGNGAGGNGAGGQASASPVSDENLAPASTTPDIGAGQTSLASVASSTSAASASASASANGGGGGVATSTTPAAAASTTSAAGGGGGGRRGGRRFDGFRGGRSGGRNGRGLAVEVKETAAPAVPASTLASLLKKRLAAMGEEFDGVVLA